MRFWALAEMEVDDMLEVYESPASPVIPGQVPSCSTGMNTEQFATCVRAYFPDAPFKKYSSIHTWFKEGKNMVRIDYDPVTAFTGIFGFDPNPFGRYISSEKELLANLKKLNNSGWKPF